MSTIFFGGCQPLLIAQRGRRLGEPEFLDDVDRLRIRPAAASSFAPAADGEHARRG